MGYNIFVIDGVAQRELLNYLYKLNKNEYIC